MTITREFLQKIRKAERPFIRRAIELGQHFAETRKLVTNEGGDWNSLKAILKAEILDEEGGENLDKVLRHDGDRTAYADMLGLDPSKMNNKNFSSAEPKPLSASIQPPDSGEAVPSSSQAPQPLAGGTASSIRETAVGITAGSGEPASVSRPSPSVADAGSLSHGPDDINDLRNHSFRRGPKAVVA